MVDSLRYKEIVTELSHEAERSFEKDSAEYDLFMDINLYGVKKLFSYELFGDPEFTERMSSSYYFGTGVDVSEYFSEAKEQYEYYKNIITYKDTFGDRVDVWISTLPKWEDWKKCLEIVEWNISKISNNGSDKPIYRPTGDNRSRSGLTKSLWVLNRSWNGKPEDIDREDYYVGIIDQIERKIHRFKNDQREFVRYKNAYYPIQSRFHFASLKTEVRRGTLYFFSNLHRSPDPIQDIVPMDFICDGEGVKNE